MATRISATSKRERRCYECHWLGVMRRSPRGAGPERAGYAPRASQSATIWYNGHGRFATVAQAQFEYGLEKAANPGVYGKTSELQLEGRYRYLGPRMCVL